LISQTVNHENPELEQRKKLLLEQEEQLTNKLTKLEATLLNTLGNSTGNILENQVFIIFSFYQTFYLPF
jgi:dynein heavy chain 2